MLSLKLAPSPQAEMEEQARKRSVLRGAGWPGNAGSDPDPGSCILQETWRKPRAFQGFETHAAR